MRLAIRLLFLVLAIALAAAAVGYRAIMTQMQEPLQHPKTLHIEVHKGDTIHQVAKQLQQQQAIEQSWPFVLYARYMDKAHKIKAGEYDIAADSSLVQLLDQLVAGKVIQYSVTLVEGLTSREYLQLLEAQPNLKQPAKKYSADMAQLMRDLGAGHQHPEGRFFPDTYFYAKSESVLDISRRAYQQMGKVLAEEWQGRAKGLPYETPEEALIMASIVEKETGVPNERGQIAGVFVRRLQKSMRLQTDPTVIYGLGDDYKGNIRRRHLRLKTAYNTYQIDGLPPTPIANPGKAAIHAALHPEPGKALYFVARGDGSHVFSNTLSAHNKAVRQFQLQRRANYRSAPASQAAANSQGAQN